MEDRELLSRYVGCFLGSAIGDALGAPVEFLNRDDIISKHGEKGIREFLPWQGFPAGAYTDDTQMSMATAVGCIRAHQQQLVRGSSNIDGHVWRSYKEWRRTQNDPAQRRAPGSTCLAVLHGKEMGTISEPINNSKGCGGVMRTAPVGLAYPPAEAFAVGAMCAALTHGHPSGYLSAGFLSALVSYVVRGLGVREGIHQALPLLESKPGFEETHRAVKQGVTLAGSTMPEHHAIQELGQGWVGDEAIGISVYCALRHESSYLDGVPAAVNHSGDSDSTGCITGAILGAHLGVGGLPRRWIDGVENGDGLKKVARDLFLAFVKGQELSIEEYPEE